MFFTVQLRVTPWLKFAKLYPDIYKQMEAKFFKTQSEFRKWLEENHDKETELIVGYYKVGSGRPSITWSQSVDQALCFGKQESTRLSRLEKLIHESRNGNRIY